MTALETLHRGGEASPSGPLVRVSVRSLAAITGLMCFAALLLTYAVPGIGSGEAGPPGVVAGQAVWNAAQVGLLLLLASLVRVDGRAWTVALAGASIACLPFSIYLIGPGGWLLATLLLMTCGLAGLRRMPYFGIAVTAPARGGPVMAKFEFLAFVCNLLCSMYNFAANNDLWPHWGRIFAAIGSAIGFEADQVVIAHGLFTLGIAGLGLPDFIAVGKPANNFGALVFALIWTVLPTLYVVYFALLAWFAEALPGRRIQQVLCAVCIAHFLFFTDVVDYRYGRGIANTGAVWAHWLEVFAWRVAILLPIYQKLVSGEWRTGNGKLGVALHYGIAAWAAFFLIYEVLLLDVARFASFAMGLEFTPIRLFGLRPQALGYHGALVLMTLVYGASVVGLRCKRISMSRLEARAGDGTVVLPPRAS